MGAKIKFAAEIVTTAFLNYILLDIAWQCYIAVGDENQNAPFYLFILLCCMFSMCCLSHEWNSHGQNIMYPKFG